MGIWIRSQDKEELIEMKAFSFKIQYQHKETKELYNTIYGNEEEFVEVYSVSDLGNYSSKEKAIKVLDMIQEHIENQNNYFSNLNAGTEYGGLIVTQKSKVFNMPLDEEVKA